MKRAATLTVFLALTVLGASTSSAMAAEPIEGQWQETSGRVLEFFATGPNTFSARVVSGASGACPNAPGNMKLTGSGLNYSGTVTFYRSSDCTAVGDGQMVVTIAADGQTMRIGYTQPSGQSCCSSQSDATRKQAAAPPAVVFSGTLAEIINQALVQIKKSGKRFASVRSAALQAQTKVKNYRVTSPTEATLRTCGLQWLKYIAAVAAPAKHSKAGVAAGAANLARCLSPFRQLFPGGKPGTVVTKQKTAKPKKPPAADSQADNYFGVGTDPNLIPRIDFAYDPVRPDRIDHVRNIHISVRVACLGKVFYLVLGPEYFPVLNVAPGNGIFGTASGPVTYATIPSDQPNQYYEVEVYLAGILDGTYGAHGTLKVQRRQGSNTAPCSNFNYKRWYATRK